MRANGSGNWQIAPQAQAPEAGVTPEPSAAPSEGGDMAVVIKSASIDGGTLIYRDLTTGSFTGTNGVQVIWGEYGMGIRIHDDGTTYTITGGGPLLTTTARTEQYHYSSTCEGASRTDYPEPTESQSGALFPILLPVMKPIGADTNIIQGTHRETDTSGENPAINEFVWSFRRVQQR